MPTSIAAIPTDTPERYAKQLLSHLRGKNTVEPIDGAPEGDGCYSPMAPARSGRNPGGLF